LISTCQEKFDEKMNTKYIFQRAANSKRVIAYYKANKKARRASFISFISGRQNFQNMEKDKDLK
jgi:hypothetical protein